MNLSDEADFSLPEVSHSDARIIEAVVMISPAPVPSALLAELLERPVSEVENMCKALAASYEEQARGFMLAHIAGGWRFQSHPDMAQVVERFVLEGRASRLSSAALETLAVVAYKQPVSRAQIAAVRGVDVDGVLRLLNQRGLVCAVGNDPGPGQAILYGTTPLFLEKLGLGSLDDLPPLADLVPGSEVVEALEQSLRPR